jgi:hypothetical protein
MLDLFTQDAGPLVLPMLVDGKLRCRKVRICKCADRNRRDTRPAFDNIGDRGAAIRTETISSSPAAIGDALPCSCFSLDDDPIIRPPRLCSKSRATAPLAFQAMADRDPDRFSLACCAQGTASAAGRSRRHGLSLTCDGCLGLCRYVKATPATTGPGEISAEDRARCIRSRILTLVVTGPQLATASPSKI